MAFYANFAYEASAGSGKTFALVIRYVSLLFMGAKPESILALTFTNKAANEMSARISSVLRDLDKEGRKAELKEIAKTLEESEEAILARQDKIYHDYLTADIKISTIDKFFAQILRKFSLHLGLMPDFAIDEKEDEEKFLRRFLSLVKKEEKYKSLILFSAKEQKKLGSIFEILDNLYVKDGELTSLMMQGAETTEQEAKILDLADRMRELFYSCETLSERAKKSLDFLTVEDVLTKTWLCKESMEYWDFKKCFTPMADEIQAELKSEIAAYHQGKDAYLKEAYFSLYTLFKAAKKAENIQSNVLKFNDVSFFVHQLLRGEIDSAFLYFRLDAKIEHLLLDEFQDTNVLQYSVLEPIVDEIAAGLGTKGEKSFFYVGDIKQSIYRFRGGAKELFHHTANRFGVQIDALSTNYRSDDRVVDFVNETFRDKIHNYIDQTPKERVGKGYVSIVQDKDLLESVVENTMMLLKAGVSQDDIAILTYANDAAFRIEEALLKKDATLDITTETSIKLINNPKVSTVIELLKYLYFKSEDKRYDLFKVNFLVSIGKGYEEEPSFLPSPYLPLPEMIREIIKYYELNERDENLLKLITLSASYTDIESFLFESEVLNVDSPSKKSSGIRLLTIHKSKGLEFDHVLVVDRFKKKSGDRSSMIFDYDDVHLKDIFVKFKNRECVDARYLEAKEREKKLSLEDELNVQYVAFTRAKSSLIICQKEKGSAFENLGLKPATYGTLDIVPKELSLSEEIPFEYTPISVGRQEKTKEEKVFKESIAAIHFGTALHYMLENLQTFDLSSVDEAYWAMKNRYEMMLGVGEAEMIRARVLELLSHEAFLALVDGHCMKEQPIAFSGQMKQIDLLVEREDEIVVIDYKSSKKEQKAHLDQVRGYKEAMGHISEKTVLGYLCYLREEGIVLVEV